MSTYPTPAELAAFRRSIASPYNSPHGIRYSYGPLMTDTTLPAGNYRGAWSHELRDGIGYRLGNLGNRIYSAYEPSPAAIREASALRSRAYARGIPLDAATCCLSHDHYRSPFDGTVYATSDGLDCHPMLDHWTWDDEPRSPLPIRYQAAFIITR